MLAAALALALSADPSACEKAPPPPKIPLASEFQCPVGATSAASTAGVECIGRDGRATGDTFAIDGKSGLMVHPLGMTVAWVDGSITFWQLRPTGHRVSYEGGREQRVEHYVGGDLQCARHFEGRRLVRRFEAGQWTWFDSKGKGIDLQAPLDRTEIAAVVREHQSEVQLCYESRLHEIKGEFRGTVAVTLEISRGEVKGVQITEDTLRDPPVADCLTARIGQWKFRPSVEVVEVTFPFVFKERQ